MINRYERLNQELKMVATKRKVAAYCRVSTDNEDQANSFESQQRYFRQYIERNPDWELYEIFADEGISGTNTKKRKEFNRMIACAKNGDFDLIITKEISRFARNTLDSIYYTRELKKHGVGVIFMNDNIDTLDGDAELRLAIMSSIAQEESRKTSERVKWGQKRQMEQGVVFGRSMLGYDVEGGKMTINEEGAKVVRLIFHKFVNEGKGTHVIARELREEGISPMRVKEWSNTVILRVIRNEKYCGDLVQKKTYTPDFLSHEKKYNRGQEEFVIIKDHHEPIISRELFDEANRILDAKSLSQEGKAKHSNRYPFSGKIKCGCCGSSYVARYKTRKDGSRYKAWRCNEAAKHGSPHIDKAGNQVGCTGLSIRNEDATHIMYLVTKSLKYNRNKIINNLTAVIQSIIAMDTTGTDVLKLQEQIKKIEGKRANLIDLYMSNLINKDEFTATRASCDAEIEELQSIIESVDKQREMIEQQQQLLKEIEDAIKEIVSGVEYEDEFYKHILDKMVVQDKDNIDVYLNLLPMKWSYTVAKASKKAVASEWNISEASLPGVVITYYLTPAEYAKNYTLTIQSLLNGYQNENDGTIIVADKGVIIASNDESMIGQSATENEAIQSLKQHDIHENMAHLTVDGTYSYGIMKKQSSRYIYIYVPEKVVFSALPQNVMATFLLYVIAISLMWLSLRKSKENSLRIEREKEQDYQRNLLEAAKKAEAANQAKTEFLQRMSHDIRTPINGIRGMVDVGDYYYDDLKKQSECRNKIREASNILLELVNEVLDMSKLESGEIFLEEKPFNIDEVIQEVCDVVDQLAKERKIQVDMDLGPIQHMNLVGSAMHLKRLLMNVLSNAVKYNKDHGSIHLSCHELPSDQMETAAFEFICEDSGIGMSEDFQKHIYEPFTQEKKGGASKFGGTGLGMPITKKLVEKMGGNITFESESGIGTTFTITIPFKINAEVEQCEDTQELSLHALDGFHILLVEDNELNMEIAEFSLQNAGAKITKAWNGQEAVEIFQASSIGDFDVILMDVMMPVMDGYEATKNIRSLSREDAKTIPIIAMTANAFSEDKIKAEEAGMNEHIAKPINMKLLLRIVSKLVNQS